MPQSAVIKKYSMQPHRHTIPACLQSFVATASKRNDDMDWNSSKQVAMLREHIQHTHARAHARTHARPHARTNARTHAITHAPTHTHARTHARSLARSHARTLARSHAHTHTQVDAIRHAMKQGKPRLQNPARYGAHLLSVCIVFIITHV